MSTFFFLSFILTSLKNSITNICSFYLIIAPKSMCALPLPQLCSHGSSGLVQCPSPLREPSSIVSVAPSFCYCTLMSMAKSAVDRDTQRFQPTQPLFVPTKTERDQWFHALSAACGVFPSMFLLGSSALGMLVFRTLNSYQCACHTKLLLLYMESVQIPRVDFFFFYRKTLCYIPGCPQIHYPPDCWDCRHVP